jgi:carbohydrate-binding DOMON domain-containing protein
MTDSTIPVRLDDVRGRRMSASSGARVLIARVAPCVLDLLGRARPQAHAAMESAIAG